MTIEEAEMAVAEDLGWPVRNTVYGRLDARGPDDCVRCGKALNEGEAVFRSSRGAVCGDRQGCRKRAEEAAAEEAARKAAVRVEREREFNEDVAAGKVTL